ncbi:hypothetical protein ANCCEY_07704 [Ancylostoma ceylanicum]|uniref:Uncharacterized protein n=1 Tax=Ancylostoma ceylanicum TaxID=53326 RepID=A0A0D6LZY9_9BILA|nr:hypothetical protein ANCCEY_07704 [Ancylostoma ceylanicum]
MQMAAVGGSYACHVMSEVANCPLIKKGTRPVTHPNKIVSVSMSVFLYQIVKLLHKICLYLLVMFVFEKMHRYRCDSVSSAISASECTISMFELMPLTQHAAIPDDPVSQSLTALFMCYFAILSRYSRPALIGPVWLAPSEETTTRSSARDICLDANYHMLLRIERAASETRATRASVANERLSTSFESPHTTTNDDPNCVPGKNKPGKLNLSLLDTLE